MTPRTQTQTSSNFIFNDDSNSQLAQLIEDIHELQEQDLEQQLLNKEQRQCVFLLKSKMYFSSNYY